MRLTLRTLLAYLDDTLEPSQAKQIGQKVAESDTAQELITRIRQVTRRRRLTTPPDTGPGAKLDPNSIAEYLDNALDADQLAEVEQTCLGSDVHLAEVATCHQILTLVLGEPALVPPTAKQRMYALFQGREAIPFRKPPAPEGEAEEPAEGKEVDETLRLGLPALRRKGGGANWAVVGGGALALVACLVVALVMLLRPAGSGETDGPGPGKDRVAKADGKKADADRPGKDRDGGAKDKPAGKDGGPPAKTDEGKKDNGTKDGGKADAGKPDDKGKKDKKDETPKDGGDVPVSPPSNKVVELADYKPSSSEATVLLQYRPDRKEWARLERGLKPTRVSSGRPLVSLPGFRSVVQTDSGVRLTLAGTMPEFFPGPLPVAESLVELHASDQFDLDLTLRRGRVLLASTRGDRPVRVRVRFENTTDPKSPEMWDVTLEQKDAQVLVERAGVYSPEEPFYPNPDDPNRVGPTSHAGLIVLSGSANVRIGDVTEGLNAPPGSALVHWDSISGRKGPFSMKKLPEFVAARPPTPKGLKGPDAARLEADRAALEKGLGQLAVDLADKRAVDLGLQRALGSNDPALRKLAVRSYAALDELPKLVEALGDKRQDVRLAAIETLRQWCASSRDNDYKLLDALKGASYSQVEASNIVALLHSFSSAALARPETYDVLITQLTTP